MKTMTLFVRYTHVPTVRVTFNFQRIMLVAIVFALLFWLHSFQLATSGTLTPPTETPGIMCKTTIGVCV